MQLDGVGPRVAAEQARLARVGPEQAQQDADGGRLAGPVGPEEAVDLAGRHLQIQAVESPRRPERLHQTLDLDGVAHSAHGTERASHQAGDPSRDPTSRLCRCPSSARSISATAESTPFGRTGRSICKTRTSTRAHLYDELIRVVDEADEQRRKKPGTTIA